MKLLNMMYYFEKFKLHFNTDEIPRSEQEYASILLTKCDYLYKVINRLIEIFKLMKVIDEWTEIYNNTNTTFYTDELYQYHITNIIFKIQSFIKENPVFPMTFKYRGKCLLETFSR